MASFSREQLTTIHSSFWFISLPAEMQRFLIDNGRLVPLTARQQLYARQGEGEGLYCILSGAVRIRTLAADGREAILAVLESPQWFGEVALFDNLNRAHDAIVERDATLLHVPAATVLTFLQENPVYWRDLGRLMALKLRVLFSMAEVAILQPTPQRMARVLIAMAEGYGERPLQTGQPVRVSQEQLGRMVSLSRQAANQVLQTFEGAGAIQLMRGGFRIVDVQRLRELAI